MKPKLLILAFVIAFAIRGLADLVQVSFVPDPSDQQRGNVVQYQLYRQATNAPDKNQWTWVYQIPASTNTVSSLFMTFDATNLPSNCYLMVESCGISKCSFPSTNFFYDYPALIANSKPKAPSGVNATLILK